MRWQKADWVSENNYKKQNEERYKKIRQTLRQTTNHWQALQTTKWSTDCGAANKYAGLKNAMSKQ